jgi:complex iron-sulfur molybdoenzyme family reductase subunit beta
MPLAFNEDDEFDESQSRFPMDEMRKLFGPDVEQALATVESEREKVAAGGQSELMDILISRNWNDMLGPYQQDPGKMVRPLRRGND